MAFSGSLQLIFFIGVAIVNIAFALNISKDGEQIRSEGSEPLLAGPALWSFATLLGGVFVAAIYWVVNHSTLSRR